MAVGKMWRRYAMCCFMCSCRGTKTLVTLRGSTWSFVAVVQTGGKRESLFFWQSKNSIVMSCVPQKLGGFLSYFACSVHLIKWFGCLFFWHCACFLFPMPGLIPLLSKSKMQCLRRWFWRCMLSRRQCSVRRGSLWYLEGSFNKSEKVTCR